MNNKDLLEAIGNIDDKYLIEDNYIKETNQTKFKKNVNIMKNRNYKKVAYGILSLCAILIFFIVISRKLNFPLNISSSSQMAKNNNIVQENDIELNINSAEGILKDDTVNIAQISKPVDFSMIPEVLKNLKIPEDCNDTSYCEIFVPKEDLDYNKEMNEIDYNILNGYECRYWSKDVGRSIKIEITKKVKPNNELDSIEYGVIPSKINNVELFIYNYDVEPCISPKYDKNSYYVLFNYKEYGFSINTKYITEEELVDLLKSIIK